MQSKEDLLRQVTDLILNKDVTDFLLIAAKQRGDVITTEYLYTNILTTPALIDFAIYDLQLIGEDIGKD